MTKVEKARLLLMTGEPVCGSTLVAEGVGYRYAARIADLRQSGLEIESRRCENPTHRHESGIVEYQLVPEWEPTLFKEAM